MSQIELEKSHTANIGTSNDIDENNKPFNKLTINVTHPVTKNNCYMEYSKQDSKNLLIESNLFLYNNI